MPLNGYAPEFSIKMEGRSYAHFTGQRDAETIKKLYEFLKRENWRGRLMIHFAGNGGVTDVIFEEVKKMTIEK